MPHQDVMDRFPLDSPYCVSTWPAESYDDAEQLAGAVLSWARQLQLQKWPLAIQYFTNYAFLMGQPYTVFYFNGHTLTTNTPESRIGNTPFRIPKTVDDSLIRPFELNIAMMTETKPMPLITPRSDRPEDEDAAKLSSIVLQVLWEKPLRMQEKLRQLVAMLLLTGTAAMEVAWDDNGAVVMAPKVETKTVEDPLLGTVEVEEEAGEEAHEKGKLRVNTYNAFQIDVDPAATSDPDSIGWIMISTYQDKGWIQEAYDRDEEGYFPDNLDMMNSEDVSNTPLYWNERIKDLIDAPDQVWGGYAMNSLVGGAKLGANQVIMRTIDVKPNKHYPKGRTLVVAGGQLLYAGPSRAWSEKYPDRWTPITLFRYWTVPDRFWGMAMFTKLVPLQRRINAIDSLVQMSRQFLTLGSWLIPKHSMVDGHISGIPGQNIIYTPINNMRPEKIDNQALPAQLLAERDYLIAAIDKISGASIALMGGAPANTRSAAMLDFYKRQSLASKAGTFHQFEEGIEEVSQNILIAVATHLTEPDDALTERIRMAARDHAMQDIVNFVGTDLRDNTTVSIDIVSRMWISPEAKKERAVELIQYLGPLMTPGERKKAVGLAGFDEFDVIDNSHVIRARRMISRVNAGALDYGLVIEGVDDPQVFADELRKEIQRPTFEESHPAIQQKLLQLFDEYRMLIQQQQQQELAIRLQMAGRMPQKQQPERPAPGLGTEPEQQQPTPQ